ncbi:hypothetical protein VPHD148_0166 [Vibrio phage D148]
MYDIPIAWYSKSAALVGYFGDKVDRSLNNKAHQRLTNLWQ